MATPRKHRERALADGERLIIRSRHYGDTLEALTAEYRVLLHRHLTTTHPPEERNEQPDTHNTP
ncbi:hypothetical protein ACFVIM_04865 [Streptomyces sp. NPDC057638]|uniref:hypothetical protein n=1 Tax=Streptomyces sp. NPDC057638 TaxID=3346190 RepID=UPI0036777E6D